MATPRPESREVAPVTNSPAEVLERVIIQGDLSKLSSEQKVEYYKRMCDSLGLNPMTRPFAYIVLNSKLVLYALRDCTDQLRKVHGVSVIDTRQEELEGVYIVVAVVKDKTGRTDTARGAVTIAGLKGEALANAIMKTETKAKRRATLSICGLGVLDETEIEDIEPRGNQSARKSSAGAKRDCTNDVFNEIRRNISTAPDLQFLSDLPNLYRDELATLPLRWGLMVSQEFEDKWRDLGGDRADCPMQAQEEPG